MYYCCTVHTIDNFNKKKFDKYSHVIDITMAINVINQWKKKHKMH